MSALVKIVPSMIVVRRQACVECGKFLTWDEMGYGHDCEEG